MRKIAFILPLVLIVVTSGCTVPGTGITIPFIPDFFGDEIIEYEHDVLVIRSIRAVSSTIVPGQTFRIIVDIENTGKDTINDAEVKLYDWCSSVFTINQASDGSTVRSAGSSKQGDLSMIKLSKILPSEIKEVYWELKSSSKIDIKTICPQDGMKVYVKYTYTTGSTTTIELINDNELQKLLEEGKFSATQSVISVDYGPIKPYLTVEDQQPIPQGSGSTVIGIQIENRGNGFLSDYTISHDNVEIKLPNYLTPLNPSECTFKDTGKKEGTMKIYEPKEDIRLIKGKSPKLLCEVKIPPYGNPPTGLLIERTATIRGEMVVKNYNYEFRGSAAVVVDPKF
jgi:hypothetical protein